jgi:uncharacterized protein HemX
MDYVDRDHPRIKAQENRTYQRNDYPSSQSAYNNQGPPRPQVERYQEEYTPSRKGMGGGLVFFLTVLSFVLGGVATYFLTKAKDKLKNLVPIAPAQNLEDIQTVKETETKKALNLSIAQQHEIFKKKSLENIIPLDTVTGPPKPIIGFKIDEPFDDDEFDNLNDLDND